MRDLTFRLHRKGTAALAALALLALTACVDPTLSTATSGQPPLPKAEENVYVASMDAGIQIPALPVEKIPETYRRQVVDYASEQVPGTIIIDPSKRLLYYVLNKRKAIRYGIAVGKAGFEWSGEAVVAEKKPWPTWTPPKEMIERKPELAKWEKGQPGGPTNPLGARAIYLLSNGVDYGYRIHGTPEWNSIGRNASSGCIRMINQDVIDLYSRVKGGEKVIVLTASGEMPKGLYIPKPPAVKKKPAPIEVALPPLPAPPALDPELLATPAAVVPAAVTQVVAPAVTPAPATAPAADPIPACTVPLVNGACPVGKVTP
ncbi:MAG: L,D-transpeptidase [Tabrizicola sp.]|uniref:L,D-transpeptidase n=1 Tax=Tabrizicola sp. TaxID=2005166 RepID=UPI002736346A|nr:L,D-transpeptidase [Tabrizicola sp.]MDP3263362.1 L,D-transpeptidase [Tabrizicola sp.]MDP3646719.1 L,D-transpeptidase [Paracoccaceae bacterium]MDZ4067545.1 L,D-transpeptidase [Tabrizicola sp.]